MNILSDIMELLFRDDIGTTVLDLTITMHGILRTVIQSTIAMDRESTLVVCNFFSEIIIIVLVLIHLLTVE